MNQFSSVTCESTFDPIQAKMPGRSRAIKQSRMERQLAKKMEQQFSPLNGSEQIKNQPIRSATGSKRSLVHIFRAQMVSHLSTETLEISDELKMRRRMGVNQGVLSRLLNAL